MLNQCGNLGIIEKNANIHELHKEWIMPSSKKQKHTTDYLHIQ